MTNQQIAFLLGVAAESVVQDIRTNRSLAATTISQAFDLIDDLPNDHDSAKEYVRWQYGLWKKSDWVK